MTHLRRHLPRLGLGALFMIVPACKPGDKPATAKAASAPAGATHAAESFGDVVIAPRASAYKVVQVQAPGSVTGTVTAKGTFTAIAPTPTGSDGPVCGGMIPDGSVKQQGTGLGDVVVWLDGVGAGKSPGLERRVELESNHCALTPRVQAAVTGSAVNIIGHDDFRQHLRFTAGGETAPRALILLGGGEQVIPTELPFKAPGMVMVRDSSHSWTRAYLAVFDHPYFAVTTPNGAFTIDGVPAGKYTLHAWHERAGTTTQEVQVAANGAVKVSIELTAH